MKSRELSWDSLVSDYYGNPRVRRDEATGCLLWEGKLDRDGYASRIKVGGKEYRPHRLAYELHNGVVPKVVDHTCHTFSTCTDGANCIHRRCIEPSHLESVTADENIRRGNTGLHKKCLTKCVRGHEFSPNNTIVRANGSRKCRKCAAIRDQEYRARKKLK